MKMTVRSAVGKKLVVLAAGFTLGWLGWNGSLLCLAQTPVPALPPGVSDVVKLAQAKMSDDVILAYVKNNNVSGSLTADQIVYLSSQGVSQSVISALLQSAPAAVAPTPAPPAIPAVSAPPAAPPPPGPPPAPAVPAAPVVPMAPAVAPPPVVAVAPPAVSFDSFHDQLAPYGSWIQVAGYGWCWRPTEGVVNPLWRPYGDRGHWVYTENGWFWQSDYPWGDIAFHYGRWFRDPGLGWMWIPDYTWGPAWVAWRHSEGYAGWAPLPPAARFVAGVGLMYNGRVGVELDFGLRPEHFTFVAYDHFWDHDLHRVFVPRERVMVVYRGSRLENGYRFDHGRFVVEGVGRERIGLYTHRRVEVEVAPRGRVVERRVEVGVGDRGRVVEKKVEVGVGAHGTVVEKKTTIEVKPAGRGRPDARPDNRGDDRDKNRRDH